MFTNQSAIASKQIEIKQNGFHVSIFQIGTLVSTNQIIPISLWIPHSQFGNSASTQTAGYCLHDGVRCQVPGKVFDRYFSYLFVKSHCKELTSQECHVKVVKKVLFHLFKQTLHLCYTFSHKLASIISKLLLIGQKVRFDIFQ